MGTRLVEDGKPSDGLRVQLHPLALLTISDLLTRHKIRDDLHSQFVGGLLGQQNGREISIEHAFEARLDREGLDTYRLDMPWLQERVEQCD
jgi:COP9 signalosome complex subunit 6